MYLYDINGGGTKLHNKKIHNLHSSSNVIMMIKKDEMVGLTICKTH